MDIFTLEGTGGIHGVWGGSWELEGDTYTTLPFSKMLPESLVSFL